MAEQKQGIIYGILAYMLWGILPIYWKLLETTGADIVLAHRIIWSFVFMIAFILVTKRWTAFTAEWKRIIRKRKTFITIASASIVISLNWLVFIWAVQHDFVVQASLGYYINPLVSVLFAIIFLKESLSKGQLISFLLAGIGVVYLTMDYGVFPWVSLVLAFSFASYGLLKKIASIDATFSLAIETLVVTPIALLYLWATAGASIGFSGESFTSVTLLIGAGVATAIPLLLFGSAVLYIPLSMVGFLQYIAPTFMLVLGVFLYDEPFTQAHLITFTLIWVSLVLYMYSSFQQHKKSKAVSS